ncbi:guanine deaminase [Saccharata proteae CBS 121410]|uniref:Guanine deaminase n=1 Tax=Saccharata proteae CBS 121410 TaxID=1314787 RepID=A0A9P4HRU4_9PEZI|nr:guanine deaminase [Saccharata proteae CBS 121410]
MATTEHPTPLAATPINRTVYVGAFAHSKTLKELEICPRGAIGVDEDGKIAFVARDIGSGKEGVQACLREYGWTGAGVVEIADGGEEGGSGFFFPGFIDTHIHAPQHPNTGLFGHHTLLTWLHTYTFPREASLQHLPTAHRIYTRLVHRTLSHGTTTAAYYATIHVPATLALASICLAHGQRAFVGRVCMDRQTVNPDTYRDEGCAEALAKSAECVAGVRERDAGRGLVWPILTPRFAPSCSVDALAGLGAMMKADRGLWAQTHISENEAEVRLVAELFPDATSYADVYDRAGLLNGRMVLAHAVHLTTEEKELVRRRDAKVAHCPASNTALTSGCCPVRELLERGITVGLGTDVSGGYSPSVLEMCRQAILVSRHRAMVGGEGEKLAVEEALYLATRGGAKVLGLESRVGGFEVGMEWDAQMVRLGGVDELGEGELEGPVDVFGWESWEDRIAKWLYSGDDRNTVAVWVNGRLVHKTDWYLQ